MFAWLPRTGVPVRIAALVMMSATLAGCAYIERRFWTSPPAALPAPEPEPVPVPPSDPGPAPVSEVPVEDGQIAACGQLGGPDCPLQAWMDNRLSTAFSTGDFPEVARSFRELAAEQPEGLTTWVTWAEQGANAAERRDVAGVQKVCLGCHEDTREAYRKTMRDRPIRAAMNAAP
jgi:hypothetical protein